MRKGFRNILGVLLILATVLFAGAGLWAFDDEDMKDEQAVVKIRRIEGRSQLAVPKSFEGRNGSEYIQGFSVEALNRIEYSVKDISAKFQGTASRFAYDTRVTLLKGLAWESRKMFPRRNACMDCHANGFDQARTQLWIGEEHRTHDPKLFRQGSNAIQFADADSDKGFMELRHSITPHQSLVGGVGLGHIRSFRYRRRASSKWVGWSWADRKIFNLYSELKQSKVDGFDAKREFIGRLGIKMSRRFTFDIQGGILLDGFGQYDVGYSDMGTILTATMIGSEKDLPSIYQRLKNDAFGYYSFQARYEYAF
jgi:hypothetical protein